MSILIFKFDIQNIIYCTPKSGYIYLLFLINWLIAEVVFGNWSRQRQQYIITGRRWIIPANSLYNKRNVITKPVLKLFTVAITVDNNLLLLSFTLRDLNATCIHVSWVRKSKTRLLELRVDLKFWQQACNTNSRSRFCCAYISYRLCLSAALDKENKTHHPHFTPAKASALIARNPLGALQLQGDLLALTRILVER